MLNRDLTKTSKIKHHTKLKKIFFAKKGHKMFKKADSIDKETGVQKRVKCSAHGGNSDGNGSSLWLNATNKPVGVRAIVFS